MEKEKESFFTWINEHKMHLIMAGVSITAIVVTALSVKNQKALEDVWESLKRMTEKAPKIALDNDKSISGVKDFSEITIENDNISAITRSPHAVSEHIRNLPNGYKASSEKIELAIERGFELLPGQTIVKSYETGGNVA